MNNKEFDVYIGGGITKRVKPNETMVFYLDFEKLEDLVNRYNEVVVGASGDWFFTGRSVDKKDLKNIKDGYSYILDCSCYCTIHCSNRTPCDIF